MALTVLAQLVAVTEDTMGYITYVFQLLEETDINRLDTRYVMTTRFPNWNHRTLKLEEIGYLEFIEIKAGIDKWYDGNNMILYNYNNIQFLKFIERQTPRDTNYVI